MDAKYGGDMGKTPGNGGCGAYGSGFAGRGFPDDGRAAKEVRVLDAGEVRGLVIDPRFRRPAVLMALYVTMCGDGNGERKAAAKPGAGKGERTAGGGGGDGHDGAA